jgi:hypothetical protein
MKNLFLFIPLLLSACAHLAHPRAVAGDAPEDAVRAYHEGLIGRDAAKVRRALGDALVMVNGNFSDDPRRWEAHQFLAGPALEDWPQMMVREAGPFANDWQVVHVSTRGDAALVVTVETGRNRFRSWNREVATWMLGREATGWKIVGLYLRDVANPGQPVERARANAASSPIVAANSTRSSGR